MGTSALDRERLGRMHDVLAGHVERGELPGLVSLVARDAEVHVDSIGTLAVDATKPVQRDSLFRISSMTKPITAVAALILVEECKLRLDEPVDRLLPELANRRVLKRLDGPIDQTVPATRPITLRDLLTFRMGFGMLMGTPEQYPILRAVHEQFGPPGPPQPGTEPPLGRRHGNPVAQRSARAPDGHFAHAAAVARATAAGNCVGLLDQRLRVSLKGQRLEPQTPSPAV